MIKVLCELSVVRLPDLAINEFEKGDFQWQDPYA